MNKEFEQLYNNWYYATCFKSYQDFDNDQDFINLINWCKENKKDAIKSIIEILEEQPSDVVYILDVLFDHPLEHDGYASLMDYCNVWLNLLKGYSFEKNADSILNGNTYIGEMKDYYKEYKEYHEYLKENYIHWNPYKEDDPNITLEEYKMGKRNNPNCRRPIQMVELNESNYINKEQ